MAEPMGFFTDTTVCIGCKACEVACKQWNQLPAINGGRTTLSGNSYDNTGALDGLNWRHVKFVEQFNADRSQARWLLMSDVCKHCVRAACLEVCPTGAIIRTEFDTVVIQSDVCNGCRYCIAACPFDVIGINEASNTAMKCTLCYDRLGAGLTPACAQACPTASIQFGPISDLTVRAQQRVQQLEQRGEAGAYIYGQPGDGFTDALGGLNSFYLLVDKPEVYGLPARPTLPSRNVATGWLFGIGSGIVAGVLGLLSFRKQRMKTLADTTPGNTNMLLERANELGWTWLVVAEMFLAGVAAGAYATAAILELSDRGRSAVARVAHLIPFPLMAIASVLLILDLTRPERFWHMVIMNEVLLPILKPWSPMSMGTWLVVAFTGFAFVSFVDALVVRRMLRIARWRDSAALHGSAFGKLWSIVGALLGLGVGTYSGVLLSTSNIPGWGQTPLLGAVYVATALSTGCAAVVLVAALAGEADTDLLSLVRTSAWLIGWWLVVVLGFVVAVPASGAASPFLTGVALLAIVAAIVLAGVLPLLLQLFSRPRASGAAVSAILVLVGGLLLRYGLMLGPQTQFR